MVRKEIALNILVNGEVCDEQKLGYMNGHYTQMYPGQAMVGANTLMPMYPLYHYHQSHAMGMPAHIFPPSPTAAGPFAAVPPTSIMSKPASVGPNPGPFCLNSS